MVLEADDQPANSQNIDEDTVGTGSVLAIGCVFFFGLLTIIGIVIYLIVR